jgi:hypothetical protein
LSGRLNEEWAFLKFRPNIAMGDLAHGSELGLVICTIRGLRHFVSWPGVACSDRDFAQCKLEDLSIQRCMVFVDSQA